MDNDNDSDTANHNDNDNASEKDNNDENDIEYSGIKTNTWTTKKTTAKKII